MLTRMRSSLPAKNLCFPVRIVERELQQSCVSRRRRGRPPDTRQFVSGSASSFLQLPVGLKSCNAKMQISLPSLIKTEDFYNFEIADAKSVFLMVTYLYFIKYSFFGELQNYDE